MNQAFQAMNRKKGAERHLNNRAKSATKIFSPESIKDRFTEFIKVNDHPCLSAQSVVNNDSFEIGVYKELGTEDSAAAMAKDLLVFIKNRGNVKTRLASFMAVCQLPEKLGEVQFEVLLWKQLQLLNKVDDCSWDASVSDDPQSPKFSFSFGGKAFYIIGLHSESSRISRRFQYPTLVFNLHEQFEALRQDGHYNKMRDTIRARDKSLQGTANEMVADHGISSEAKQYSGRKVDDSWKCPFSNNKMI